LKDLILIGARLDGHAGVVIDAIEEIGDCKVIGFLDNTPNLIGTYINGIPVLGSSNDIEKSKFGDNIFFHIAIGDNVARASIFDTLKKAKLRLLTIIHPTAFVSKHAQILEGCFVGPLAIINRGGIIGPVSIINSGVIIEHDNHLGKAVHMAPGVKTAGRVKIDDFTFVGLGSCILPDIYIGQAAMIGAGSTVVKNVETKTTVFGYAARRHDKNIYEDTQSDIID
jgi:sugar O-acyltransferase (sialic acid O-acetyltransferase NeuD family)